MEKVYIVINVFEDKNDNRNRYAVGTLVHIENQERANKLLKEGFIKEYKMNSEIDAESIKKLVEKTIEDYQPSNPPAEVPPTSDKVPSKKETSK